MYDALELNLTVILQLTYSHQLQITTIHYIVK